GEPGTTQRQADTGARLFEWISGPQARRALSPACGGTNVATQTYSEKKGIEMKNSCISEAGRKPLSSQERERFEGYMAEIFSRLGMDLDNEPCRRTPHRWVQALVDIVVRQHLSDRMS